MQSTTTTSESNTSNATVTHLTTAAIKKLSEAKPNQTLRKLGYILQVLSVKELQQKPAAEGEKKKTGALSVKAKYILSDGVSSVRAMVSEAAYNRMETKPKANDVIRLNALSKAMVQQSILLIIKEPMEILYSDVEAQIGDPLDIQQTLDANASINFDQEMVIPRVANPEATNGKMVVDQIPLKKASVNGNDHISAATGPVKNGTKQHDSYSSISNGNSAANGNVQNMYMPIKALNTFSRDWKIQARVASKSDKRQTRNGGSLLKIELVDMYGTQIEGTFFNEAADIFEHKIQENKVFLFSNGVVKMANKRFTSIKNDFCIVFEKNAQIVEVADDGSIAEQAFDFTEIKNIQDIVQLKTLDIVGVITEISEKETVNLRSGQQKVRKYVTLIDDSSCSISLTLWGEMCERSTDHQTGDILAVKGARVSEFGGKSLNAADDHSVLFKNMKHQRVNQLKVWYSELMQSGTDPLQAIRSLTQKAGKGEPGSSPNEGPKSNFNGSGGHGNGEKSQRNSNLNLICEISESLCEENDTDQYHFFFLNGYVSRIKNDDRIFYPACLSDNCRRKVTEDTAGFKCEHCGKTYMTYQPTYMITAKISDFTESIYVNFAREHGTALMGMSAEEFKEFKENESEEKVQAYFDSLLFKTFNIMVKGKFEYFNGENRMRYFAVKVFPHNVQAENRALLRRLDMYKLMNFP